MNIRSRYILLLRIFLASLLAVIGFSVTTPPTFACSCAMPDSPTATLATATAVFSGVVIGMEIPAGDLRDHRTPIIFKLQVTQVWKGVETPTVEVTTMRNEAACGYSFTLGEAYLIYAHGAADDLQVSLCSRTTPLTNATADLAALGEGNPLPAAPTATSIPLPTQKSTIPSPLATPTPVSARTTATPFVPTVVPSTVVTGTIVLPSEAGATILSGDDIGFKVVGIQRDRVEVVLMVRINGEWREADLAVRNFLLESER